MHKYREQGRVVKVSEEIIFGDEKGIEEIIKKSTVSNRINTSFIERINGTFRAKVLRIVRQSYSFEGSFINMLYVATACFSSE